MANFSWAGQWYGRNPAGDQHTRARNIISRSGGIMRGKFPSRKNGRMVHHEGLLELDAIYLFETSPLVIKYREQPLKINFPDGGKLRRYTPDFEVFLKNGEQILIEVKPTRSLENEAVAHKLECVSEYLKRSGQNFLILTEMLLRDSPRQSNLRWIFHQAPRVGPTMRAMCLALALHHEKFPMSIRQADSLFACRNVDACSLLLAGLASCRLDEPISMDTEINISTEANNAWFWISQEHGF